MQIHVRTGAELDQPDSLAAPYPIADLLCEHDAAGEHAGNLFEDNFPSIAFYDDRVLLIAFGAGRVHCIQKFAFLITRTANDARHGRTIYVYIEDVKEDADAFPVFSVESHICNFSDLPFRRRNHRTSL